MGRKSRRIKRSIAKQSIWVGALAALAIPLIAVYVFRTLSSELQQPSPRDSARVPDPIVTVVNYPAGPVEQLVVSSAVMLNPESAELYQRIARETHGKVEQQDSPQPQVNASEILGPGWLLSQPVDKFTIQFMTSADLDELVAFSEQFSNAQPATIYPYRSTGERVQYGLARGVFDTFNDAQLALENYPSAWLLHKPWIRPIGEVGSQIERFIDR